jgi:hypothetical protein
MQEKELNSPIKATEKEFFDDEAVFNDNKHTVCGTWSTTYDHVGIKRMIEIGAYTKEELVEEIANKARSAIDFIMKNSKDE